jgi:hypothetical protein
LIQTDTTAKGAKNTPLKPKDELCDALKEGDARLVWSVKLVDHEGVISEKNGDQTLAGHFDPRFAHGAAKAFDNILKYSVIQPLIVDYMTYAKDQAEDNAASKMHSSLMEDNKSQGFLSGPDLSML